MINRFPYLLIDTTVAALLLFPVFVVLYRYYFHDLKRTIACYILAIYISAVFSVAGLPDIGYIRFRPNCNFRPFAYMFSDLTTTLLNILLFIPFGLMLPLLWISFQKLSVICFTGLLASVFIEIMQIFTYRATDVNDLMTNTAGTFLGWILAKLLLHILPVRLTPEPIRTFPVVAGISLVIMFFLHPLLSHCIGL